MRRPAQWVWRASTVAASVGALRLLPAHDAPPVLPSIVPHIPPGGTASVATRRADHHRPGTRSVGFTLDADGRPHSVVKLVTTDKGRARLAAEAEALERLGPLLPPPLHAPEVFHAEPGVLVLKAARWKVRCHPWRLDPEIAHALGQFYAAGGTAADGSGLAHGDFAPWNLLQVDDGWCLVDWEEAGEGRPPFEDVFHYVVQSCALLDHPSPPEVLDGLSLNGPVGELFTAYADGAGITTDDVIEQFSAYLERTRETDVEARLPLRAVLAAHYSVFSR